MLTIVLVFLVISVQIRAKEINCETIEWMEWKSFILRYRDNYPLFQETCHLNGTTVISEENVELGGIENVNIGAILFDWNKNIHFLPVKVHKKFPNLEIYSAENAAVEKISALNFAGLSKLKLLYLNWNKIEIIPEDCFQGLIQLQKIYVNGNKIKTVNALAFANLPHLGKVNLSYNVCISVEFTINGDLSDMRRKLSRSCWLARPPMSCITRTTVDETKRYRKEIRTDNVCEVEPGTYVDKPDFKLASNSTNRTIKMLWIENQRHVDFLPVSIYEQLPNLREYFIRNTPIRKISKKNFEKLQLLEILELSSNQIEVIKSDTFEDLINLETISIRNQPLIALNGKAFINLLQLEHFDFYENQCISEHLRRSEDWHWEESVYTFISDNCGFDEFDSVDIECESYSGEFCVMTNKTVINGTNFVIADKKDEKLEGITFLINKKVEYLPYKIYMQFPNLLEIHAPFCSIKQISKENFENLNRLDTITLTDNQIQKIFGNTFKGLKSLRRVDLRENQIKAISGRTFDQLPLLKHVDLAKNECIDDIYSFGGSKIYWNKEKKDLTRKIIQQCAFTETGEREFEKLFDIECGIGKRGQGFIVGGNKTQKGQWPFKAALVLTKRNQFFCGGSIITALHVLTAAHCIQNKYVEKPKNASEIALLLGRNDLENHAEVGSEIRGVKEIKIHPNWNSSDYKFEGDIAVLEMDRPVQFSELIQPVCLTFEPELSQKEAGYVVGWGKSGESSARHENIPRQVLISSVADGVCFAKDYRLGSMFSGGMFCAGGDGFGPCYGDSGGGFFVRYEGLWTLRGIVSSGTTRDGGGCDVDRFTLFTNAVDYAEWIKDACEKNETLTTSPGEPNIAET